MSDSHSIWLLLSSYDLGHGRDTSTEVEMGDVYQEVDEVMTKLRVGMHKIKPCSRKYAFELSDVPKEADYLKLMYPYDSERSRRRDLTTVADSDF